VLHFAVVDKTSATRQVNPGYYSSKGQASTFSSNYSKHHFKIALVFLKEKQLLRYLYFSVPIPILICFKKYEKYAARRFRNIFETNLNVS